MARTATALSPSVRNLTRQWRSLPSQHPQTVFVARHTTFHGQDSRVAGPSQTTDSHPYLTTTRKAVVVVVWPFGALGRVRGLAPSRASGSGPIVCIGVWPQSVHRGLAPKCAPGSGPKVCTGVWPQIAHRGLAPNRASGAGPKRPFGARPQIQRRDASASISLHWQGNAPTLRRNDVILI